MVAVDLGELPETARGNVRRGVIFGGRCERSGDGGAEAVDLGKRRLSRTSGVSEAVEMRGDVVVPGIAHAGECITRRVTRPA